MDGVYDSGDYLASASAVASDESQSNYKESYGPESGSVTIAPTARLSVERMIYRTMRMAVTRYLGTSRVVQTRLPKPGLEQLWNSELTLTATQSSEPSALAPLA